MRRSHFHLAPFVLASTRPKTGVGAPWSDARTGERGGGRVRGGRTGWLGLLAVAAITLAAWAPALIGNFQYDDHDSIVTSAGEPNPGAFAEAWRNGFRPLLRSSFLADRWLWGASARGYLVTNLAVHLGCVLLVLALARKRSLSPFGTAAAALAFALQPAQSEAVAYVSGRSSSLMTLCVLAALLAHDRAAEAATTARRRAALALSLAAFCAAVAVKEVALAFPLLVVVWEATRPERRLPRVRALLAAHASLALLLAAGALAAPRLRALVDYSLGLVSPFRSLAANLAAAPELVSLWLRPGALSIEHPLPPVAPGTLAVGAALVAVAAGIGIASARARPSLALGLLWPLVALLPTNSILWKLDPISERSLYLAWFGPALAIGAALTAAFRRWSSIPTRRAALASACLALMAVSAVAVVGLERRLALWRDSRALWRDATAKAPASVRAWNNLGMAYWEHDQPAPARAAFRRALELAPADGDVVQNLLVLALSSGGDPTTHEKEAR